MFSPLPWTMPGSPSIFWFSFLSLPFWLPPHFQAITLHPPPPQFPGVELCPGVDLDDHSIPSLCPPGLFRHRCELSGAPSWALGSGWLSWWAVAILPGGGLPDHEGPRGDTRGTIQGTRFPRTSCEHLDPDLPNAGVENAMNTRGYSIIFHLLKKV